MYVRKTDRVYNTYAKPGSIRELLLKNGVKPRTIEWQREYYKEYYKRNSFLIKTIKIKYENKRKKGA